MANYLDFEEPIKKIVEQIDKLNEVGEEGGVDVKQSLSDLKRKLQRTRKEVFKDLTPWQRVQVSRHPDRPYTLKYIQEMTDGDFVELHGDRNVKDDHAMVGGLGRIDGKPVMFIGQQKGVNTKMRQYRNFGMPNPEGYRKALRLMKLAEKFNHPVVSLIDTPGAFPGLEAEERGQGEAIARNIYEMMQLQVPVICVIIGEGASGGALGIGVGDVVLMLENTWYSVISPESCASILWRTWDEKEKAAEVLKLTPQDMLNNSLIDDIIREPIGGAHADAVRAAEILKGHVIKHLDKLAKIDGEKLVSRRMRKFTAMGEFQKAKN